jgi:hypothetical protein
MSDPRKDEARLQALAAMQQACAVTWEGEGSKRKLVLPDVPATDDVAGQCRWLTAVFNLDPTFPIKGGSMQGPKGPQATVVLARAGAPDLRFEPAKNINQPAKLIEDLSWHRQPSDGKVHAIDKNHCRDISHVVLMLCDASGALDAKGEAESIVGAFLLNAYRIEGFTTYGRGTQMYEAACALGRDEDPYTGRFSPRFKYLVDVDTGEMVIGVEDLRVMARRQVGTLPHGWLDARMDALGWTRTQLDGHALPGRAGRTGPHARINVYRGHLAVPEDTAPDVAELEVVFNSASAPPGIGPDVEQLEWRQP